MARVVGLACWGLAGSEARAALMVYEYSGVITSVTAAVSPPAAVGDRFGGTFAYDPTETPTSLAGRSSGGFGNDHGQTVAAPLPPDQLRPRTSRSRSSTRDIDWAEIDPSFRAIRRREIVRIWSTMITLNLSKPPSGAAILT